MVTPALPISPNLGKRLDGHPLLLFLDIDGTLAPIAQRPKDARIPADTHHLLSELARLPETHVIALSGRAAHDARQMMDVDRAWIVGNHGVETAPPGGEIVARPDVVAFVDRVTAAAAQATAIFDDLEGIIIEDKRWSLSIHYRLVDPALVPALSARVAAVAREHGLQLTYGRKVFELRAPVDVDKGTAALDVARRLAALGPSASLLCVGDDRTDEDAFRAVRTVRAQHVTVRVVDDSKADRPETTAEFCLEGVSAVRQFLQAILARRSAAVH